MKPLILCVTGPTACGKTGVSLALAAHLPIEILCMDSMQIYRGMDIGTAKPTASEKAVCPHHMLDAAAPTQQYSVAAYAREAKACIAGILDRSRVPVLVGGTGMYLRALSLPIHYGGIKGDAAIRRRYEKLADEQGNQSVHDILQTKDPVTARRLHPNDLRRVVRALEVHEMTGTPLSAQKMPGYEEGNYRILPFVPEWDRPTLYRRIDERVTKMIEEGLADEVQALLDMGVDKNAQSMQGLGYKELIPYLSGDTPLDEAAELIRLRTRHYAKRQLTWLRGDERVLWMDAQAGTAAMVDIILGKYEENVHGH